MEEKGKITSLQGIELQSSIPYTDGTPDQKAVFIAHCVLVALFFYLFAVHVDIKLRSRESID